MTAPPVRIDRPLERQVVAGDVIDYRFRLDLDELDAAKRGRVEGPPTKLEELVPTHRRILARTYVRNHTAVLWPGIVAEYGLALGEGAEM